MNARRDLYRIDPGQVPQVGEWINGSEVVTVVWSAGIESWIVNGVEVYRDYAKLAAALDNYQRQGYWLRIHRRQPA